MSHRLAIVRSLIVLAGTMGVMPAVARGDERTVVPEAARGGWKYVRELPGVRPVARTVELVSDTPEDAQFEIQFRGTRQRFAQIRFGSENSRRIAVVIDEFESGDFELYVDQDRDRRVHDQERVDGSGRTRRLTLDAEIVKEDTVEQFPRQIELRLAAGNRLSVATLGGVLGQVSLIGPQTGVPELFAVQRLDGDANGLFSDARDRLRIDLNGDGQIDPVAEQFAWFPVLTVAGRRYAVRADRPGNSLSLDEIVGTGQLQVVVGALSHTAQLIAFEAMIYSDDGATWSLKEAQKYQEIPVGRYALGSVTMTIDTGEREPWHFVFSRSDTLRSEDWVQVSTGSQVSLEAVGKTNLVMQVAGDVAKPGESLAVNPRLYTQGGLLVNLSCRGRQIGSFDNSRSHNPCDVRLLDASGNTLSSARSGFA